MVTSHDVARLAGVSQPTVSRALRDNPKVSEETKQRVRDAAKALGYVPSETGRALSSGRTRRIGLLLTDLENQFYPHVVAPMHRELEALGYQLVLQTETSDTGQVTERLLANGLEGVLLTTTTLDSVLPVRLRDRGVPFVYFNRTSAAVEADRAVVDPTGGLARSADSHRRSRAPSRRPPSSARATPVPVSTARSRCGTHSKITASQSPPATPIAGRSTSNRVRRRAPPARQTERPTVIVCANDVVALGALNAARELGIAVPDQVSVVGFDDLPVASWPIVQAHHGGLRPGAMARAAAGLLVERLEAGGEPPSEAVTFSSRLVIRDTLAAAAA